MNIYISCFNFPTPKENDDNSDTLIEDRILTVENYNSQGLLVFTSTLEELYDIREGRDNYRDSIINTYDDNGLLVSTTNIDEFDGNGDGIFDEVLITTDTDAYDDNGLLVSNTDVFETSYSQDETIDFRSITTDTYTYDDDGLIISITTIEEVDENADGIIDYDYSKANKINTYDDNGLLLSTSYEELNNDGAIEYREFTNNAYNNDELLLFTTTLYDEYGISNARRESTTNTYNDDESLISAVYEEDEGANDIIDYRRQVTDNYDENDLVISTITVEEDYDDDGTFDRQEEITKNYNDSDLLISTITVEEDDYDDDGTFDRRRETISTNTYNDKGLLISTIEETSVANDVVNLINSRKSIINTYNDEGLLVSTVKENRNADNEIYAKNSITNTYDDDGLLVSTLVLGDGGRTEYNSFDGEIDYRKETLFSQETNYVPTVVNSISDLTVDEDAESQTIDLSNVFEDIDSDTIELSVCHNSNPELVTPVIEGNDLTLDFLEYQSGTADITVIGSADGQPGEEETFTVTVNHKTVTLYRFNNNTTETGAYLFVGKAEKDAILDNPDLSGAFTLEGVTDDGTVNHAFRASAIPGKNLIPIYRLKSSNTDVGAYLFVGEAEYESIFAEDSLQKDNWIAEGLDNEGNDIAEFYLYPSGSGLGESLYRFNNTNNGGYLFVGEAESTAIKNNSDLSEVFIYEGGAFETMI